MIALHARCAGESAALFCPAENNTHAQVFIWQLIIVAHNLWGGTLHQGLVLSLGSLPNAPDDVIHSLIFAGEWFRDGTSQRCP